MGTLASVIELNLNKRDNGLGDRSLYMGASETLACEEALYFSKIKKISKPKSLDQLIVLLKGNIGESLVEWGFGDAISFDSQVECQGKGDYSFIKAHIDFMVHFPKEDVVVEVKTTNNIPDTIRESWFRQVQLQMGLSGAKRAKVFAINLNFGFHKEFDVEFNKLIFNSIQKEMKESWDKIHNNPEQIKCTKSALCGFCEYKMVCKGFKTKNVLSPEIEEMIREQKTAKKRARVLEENIKSHVQMAGEKRFRGKEFVVELSTTKQKRLDFVKLKRLYPEIWEECSYESEVTKMNIY